MKPALRTLQVKPNVPASLASLEELAHNLHWSWMPEIESIFPRIDADLWEETGHNPALLLGLVDQKRLEVLASDIGFLSHLGRAAELLARYKVEPRWYQLEHVDDSNLAIAYFSAEFGLANCLPIYSGGLGILAGDHLKSASDLGVPLVGVGLLYQEGYFRQYLNADGWQLETYPPNDFYNMPIRRVRGTNGDALRVSVEFPGRLVHAQIWRVDVGRTPLFLLDTNVVENAAEDREITRALYGGGADLRLRQLMMLGIGGHRALVAMGIEPLVCHMNEGHAGFLGVERARHLMHGKGLGYELARDIVEDGNIFTTHTPVPAGFDVFDRALVERYMTAYIATVGLSLDDFMRLGRHGHSDGHAPFNMAVLAIRHAALRNGVSRLHGDVARRLTQSEGAWTGWPENEVPIDSVTNGIHTQSWVAPEMARLFDRYLGPMWREDVSNPNTWSAVDRIPSEELWRTHVDLRQQLVAYVRQRLRWQLRRRGAADRQLDSVSHALDPDALTIGFARRFATYKRATLLFTDVERLERIVSNVDRPVQFIFSGKAHPADRPAKELIKQVASKLADSRFLRSIVFVEDYDIEVARHLVRGVDIWLNTPQRPREASGTSGMKVVPNGGLNLSILDGWWAEGHEPGVGWAIGNGEDWEEGRDAIEANALYNLLEAEVAPLFYARDERGCPHDWVLMMKASIRRLANRFSTDRMVRDYTERFYLPAAHRYRARIEADRRETEELVAWKNQIHQHWGDVRVLEIAAPAGSQGKIGDRFTVRARVRLGVLAPSDVDVQIYHGTLDARDRVHDARAISMVQIDARDGVSEWAADLPLEKSGRAGYTVRVIPKNAGVLIPNELAAIHWAEV